MYMKRCDAYRSLECQCVWIEKLRCMARLLDASVESEQQLLAAMQHLSGDELMQVSATSCLHNTLAIVCGSTDLQGSTRRCGTAGCRGEGIGWHVRPGLLPKTPERGQAQGDVQIRCGATNYLQRQ